MNPFLGIVLALCAYGLIVWIILAILAWAGEAGERFDQTMADHYHDKDHDSDECRIVGQSVLHRFACDFGPDCPATGMPPHPDAKRLREDFD